MIRGKETTGRTYDITTADDRVISDKYKWLSNSLKRGEDFEIINDGWLIDEYNLHFYNEPAEMMYLLVWGN